MTIQIGPAWIGRTIARWVMEIIRAVDHDFAPLDYGPDPYDDPDRDRLAYIPPGMPTHMWVTRNSPRTLPDGYPASRPPMTALPPTAADLANTQPATDTGIDAIDHYEWSPGPHGHRRIRAIYSDGTPGPWV